MLLSLDIFRKFFEFMVKVKTDVYMLSMYITSPMLFGFHKFGIVSVTHSSINHDVSDLVSYACIK